MEIISVRNGMFLEKEAKSNIYKYLAVSPFIPIHLRNSIAFSFFFIMWRRSTFHLH